MIGPNQNEQLAFMNTARPTDVDLWRSQVVLEHTRPLTPEGLADPSPILGQEAMLGAMLATTDTFVIEGSVDYIPGIHRAVADLAVEARDSEEAIERSVSAAVSGMVAGGVEASTITGVTLHVSELNVYAKAREDSGKQITDNSYAVSVGALRQAVNIATRFSTESLEILQAADTAHHISEQRQASHTPAFSQTALGKIVR